MGSFGWEVPACSTLGAGAKVNQWAHSFLALCEVGLCVIKKRKQLPKSPEG